MSVIIKRKNPGWLEKLVKRYGERAELAIGWPASTSAVGIKYPDGTQVAFVAAVNNFGSASRNIPARPFMTESAAPALKATAPVAAIMVKAVNRGKATTEQALQEMGPFAVGAFQTTITDTAWVPNAARTVREKQSAKPLIDTGLLRSSLTFVVRKPGA